MSQRKFGKSVTCSQCGRSTVLSLTLSTRSPASYLDGAFDAELLSRGWGIRLKFGGRASAIYTCPNCNRKARP